MEILDKQDQQVPENTGRKNMLSGGIFVGLILIIAGCLLIFSNAGWISYDLRHVLLSWQMLLIVIGLVSLIKKQVTQGVILLVIGTRFILPRLGSLSLFAGMEWLTRLHWGDLWPLILVAVGIIIFTRSRKGHTSSHHCRHNARVNSSGVGGRFDDGFVYYSTVFNGADNVFLEPVFRGGSIENVFGGVTLDLRKTTLQEGISHLSISSVFGGTTLLIPAGWNVEIQSDSVFGGFKDKRPFTDNIEKGAKLIIKAECVFGGGEIR